MKKELEELKKKTESAKETENALTVATDSKKQLGFNLKNANDTILAMVQMLEPVAKIINCDKECTGCTYCNPKGVPITSPEHCLMCGHVYQLEGPYLMSKIAAMCGCEGVGDSCVTKKEPTLSGKDTHMGCGKSPHKMSCFKCRNK